MALHAVANFTHTPKHHCITGALHTLYTHHGFTISEDMLLGLGSGLGFSYWHQQGAPPMYGGRANVARPGEEGLEKTVGRRTGVVVESFATSSARKAEQALLESLADGEPVMVYVDMGFLPYFDLPEGYHFGGHAVVVAGYDADTRQVLIADREAELHPIALADLARARGSTFKPFPPRNAWYRFDFSAMHAPEPAEICQAIGEVATRMLDAPISNIGVEGIRKAARETCRWPQTMNADELRNACFNAFIFIDASGGTGGGIFRYMYGRFLHEAAALAGEPRFAAAGDRLIQVGDQWQQVALGFRAASQQPDPAPLLPEITAPMAAIAGCEAEIWAELRALGDAGLRQSTRVGALSPGASAPTRSPACPTHMLYCSGAAKQNVCR